MLALMRKEKQFVDLLIGGQVIATICVIDIKGNRVKLGFDAGQEVRIERRDEPQPNRTTLRGFMRRES